MKVADKNYLKKKQAGKNGDYGTDPVQAASGARWQP